MFFSLPTRVTVPLHIHLRTPSPQHARSPVERHFLCSMKTPTCTHSRDAQRVQTAPAQSSSVPPRPLYPLTAAPRLADPGSGRCREESGDAVNATSELASGRLVRPGYPTPHIAPESRGQRGVSERAREHAPQPGPGPVRSFSLSFHEKGRARPQSPCMTKETGDASGESREPLCRSFRALTPGARGSGSPKRRAGLGKRRQTERAILALSNFCKFRGWRRGQRFPTSPLGLGTLPPPNMCEAREDRGSSQIARPPAPSPKLEGKYLLCLRTRYKLILNNTDALFFLLCPDRNAVANLDML